MTQANERNSANPYGPGRAAPGQIVQPAHGVHRHDPRPFLFALFLITALTLTLPMPTRADDMPAAGAAEPAFRMHPVGWVRRNAGRTTIEIDPAYRGAMLGVDALDSIWVLFWFDRNDDPEHRSILRVHPRADPANPLRGVFATHAPVRPNLIGMTRVRILSVDDLTIEIDDIDAYDDTPVLDLKP